MTAGRAFAEASQNEATAFAWRLGDLLGIYLLQVQLVRALGDVAGRRKFRGKKPCRGIQHGIGFSRAPKLSPLLLA